MVSLLPRQAEPEANFSMHAHTHATVYSLPNIAVLRHLALQFPDFVARIAVFARRYCVDREGGNGLEGAGADEERQGEQRVMRCWQKGKNDRKKERGE